MKEYLDQYVYAPESWTDYLEMLNFGDILRATTDGRSIYND